MRSTCPRKITWMNEMRKLVLIWVFLLCTSSLVFAAPRADKDSEGFEPVSGDMMQKGESIPASRLVAGAYGFIFAAVVVYAVSVGRRARRLQEEMVELQRKLDAKGK